MTPCTCGQVPTVRREKRNGVDLIEVRCCFGIVYRGTDEEAAMKRWEERVEQHA